MARTNPPYYNEEEDEQTRREDELLSRGMNPDLGNEDDGSTILSGGLNPDRFSVGADGTILSNDDDDFASAWDNLFKAGQGTPLSTPTSPTPMVGNVAEAQQRLDEATAKSNEAYSSLQGIANDWIATIEQRREEARPRFTQEELDSRRAKSTALSTLTSALANIANGLTVGAGGLNATVPDGYQAAYEHWNDVQKRHDMRQAEFDKLTDAIYTKKYGMSKADYERLEAQRKEKGIELENERKRQYGLDLEDKRQAGATERKRMDIEQDKWEKEFAAAHPKATKTTKTTKTTKKPATPSTTFTYGGTTYTTPSGVSTEQALTAIATSAKQWLKSTKDGLNDEAVDKDITAIETALKHVGDFTDKNAEAILTALAKAGYEGDIQGILDGLTPKEEQPKKNTNTNKKAGGTSGKGDASKFEMN